MPGFWNNVGICCGSAGVAEFFLSLFRITQKQEYLDFAKRLTQQILNKATQDETGMWWVQAEHRSRPDFLQSQTNMMQGADGIGLWFLRLEEHESGQKAVIQMPDNPFLFCNYIGGIKPPGQWSIFVNCEHTHENPPS